jgi:hypothetical protein
MVMKYHHSQEGCTSITDITKLYKIHLLRTIPNFPVMKLMKWKADTLQLRMMPPITVQCSSMPSILNLIDADLQRLAMEEMVSYSPLYSAVKNQQQQQQHWMIQHPLNTTTRLTLTGNSSNCTIPFQE